MPRPINYTDEEMRYLAEILLKKANQRIISAKNKMAICRTDKKTELKDKEDTAIKLKKTLNKAHNGLSRKPITDETKNIVIKIFNEMYKMRTKTQKNSRNRITARIRAFRKRNKEKNKNPNNKTQINIKKSTKKKLNRIRKEITTGAKKFDNVILVLLEAYEKKHKKPVKKSKNK